jgi:hypothetical protein
MFIIIWKLLHSPICTHHSVSPDVGFRGNALQPVFCIESPRGTAGNTSFYKASSGNENESSANSDTIRPHQNRIGKAHAGSGIKHPEIPCS